jgi:hypothetical protein
MSEKQLTPGQEEVVRAEIFNSLLFIIRSMMGEQIQPELIKRGEVTSLEVANSIINRIQFILASLEEKNKSLKEPKKKKKNVRKK